MRLSLIHMFLGWTVLAAVTAAADHRVFSRSRDDVTVGAFYYPWHTNNNFHGGNYLRGALTPQQTPELGEYDQRNSSVISQHLAWSRKANIRVWFTSWWGPDSTEDIVIRNSILKNRNLGDFKIAILYETFGRLDVNNISVSANFKNDMIYIAKTYFGHPNYFRIQNRPVVFVYVTRYFPTAKLLQDAIVALRKGALQQGYNLYIIGDHVFQSYRTGNIDNTTCTLMDALGTYDVYGSIGKTGYAGHQAISLFGRRQKAWRTAAHKHGCAFIPSICPGYNDRAVRSGYAPLARQILPGMASGSLFEALLQQSLTLIENDYNRTGNLLLVTSWNEWHEDTQIEPTAIKLGSVAANLPVNVTNGILYDSYNTLYLDILNNLIR